MYLSFIANKAKYIIFSFLLCSFFFQIASAQSEFVEGEVFVHFEGCDAEGKTFEEAMTELEGVSSYARLAAYPYLNTALYRLPTPSEDITTHSNFGCVGEVERNYYRFAQAFGMPGDPQIGQQWSLNNRGDEINGTPGTYDADIDWFEARKIFNSSEEVVVAVIDSGIDADHPDLQGILWRNVTEIENGTDDDANGYIDDIVGWDFVDNDNTPQDVTGHGTTVASILAGVTGNDEGGVGITSSVITVMPLRVADSNGNITVADFLDSTTYAVDNGARIINYSFSGATASKVEELQVDWLNTQGILLVTSAGNGSDGTRDNIDTRPSYPTSYEFENVLSVAASDQNDQLATYSNYGFVSVDLAAPGHNIFGADLARNVASEDDLDSVVEEEWRFSHSSEVTGPKWEFVTYKEKTWLTDSFSTEDEEDINYINLTNTWVATPPISLNGGSQPSLNLYVYHELLPPDALQVGIVTGENDPADAEPVSWIFGVSSENGAKYQIDLSAYEGETVRIVFKLVANGSGTDTGVFIDKYEITYLADVVTNDSSQYKFAHGTSFAAPYVSGVAAMLLSQMIDQDVGGTETEMEKRVRMLSELRDHILDNVDPISEMAFFLDSGGRLNAYKAMCAVTSCQPFVVSFDTAASASAVEEEDGVVNLVVSREGPVDETLTVGLEVETEGATEDEDFTFAVTEIQFGVGETSKDVPVTLIDDDIEETSEEKIHFELTQPEYGDVGTASTTTLTIVPSDPFNDPIVEFDSEDGEVSFSEDVGQVSVDVLRVGDLRRVSKVSYDIVGELERTVFVSGSLEFAPEDTRKTITIFVRDDEVKNEDESFILRLHQPDTAVLENNIELQVTVTDDDIDSQNGSGGGGGDEPPSDDEPGNGSGGGGALYGLLLLCMLFAGLKLHLRKWRPGHDSNV